MSSFISAIERPVARFRSEWRVAYRVWYARASNDFSGRSLGAVATNARG